MNPTRPSYDELKQGVLTAHGANLTAASLGEDCLQVLVELGIVVRIGDGLIEATSHGERMHRRLVRGEHLTELDPQPEIPRPWLK